MQRILPKISALRPAINLIRRQVHNKVSWTRSGHNALLPSIPELFNPNFLDELIPPTQTPQKPTGPAPGPRNVMMDALQQAAHRTLTQNGAPAYDSTLSPTLDAFNRLRPFTWSAEAEALLESAWAEDPNLTLRIIWNLRSIHEGKSAREAFYRAFGWLYDHHPRTAIRNLHLLVEPVCVKPNKDAGLAHGYWKDLLNILALATVDQLSNLSQPARFLHNRYSDTDAKVPLAPRPDIDATSADWKSALKAFIKARRAVGSVARHARLVRKLGDPKYRALYVAVARLFSDRLLRDVRVLLESQTTESADSRNSLLRDITLAPKWAPSPRGTHDRHTNIATAISRLLYHGKDEVPTLTFPSALQSAEANLDTLDTVEILRSFYRRWVLTPLREVTQVAETRMSSNRWTEIKYNRVPSICMKNNKETFFRHDPAGFQRYLISVEKGYRTISGATLLPHELIAEVLNHAQLSISDLGQSRAAGPVDPEKFPELKKHREELTAMNLRVVEAQWKTLVQNLREAGTLDNSIAICDVSGSMGYLSGRQDAKDPQPILPAVSLSLLLAHVARPPFNNGFITFSMNPAFVRLDPAKSLYDTVRTMEQSDWSMNTDFNAVFLKLLLPLAIKHKIKPEDMIKRVFVFSDMQFDDAYGSVRNAATPWETNHDLVERRFKEAGYELPQIVYWDLSTFGTVSVQAEHKGVALMSGFSPAMLKVFMGEEAEAEEPTLEDGEEGDAKEAKEAEKDEFNPLAVMRRALLRPSFDGLVVVD
ncbi:hypothetical protein C8R46DRAFT_935252 [Mycena filopes]|nr:hypothetical protein C8R46DRAFT_935252 [Mycena filopes]